MFSKLSLSCTVTSGVSERRVPRVMPKLTVVALEDRIFSLKSPSSFFTMFGNVGGAVSADLATEAFEDDVQYTSRTVSCSTPTQYVPECGDDIYSFSTSSLR